MRILLALVLGSGLALAETWSGALVDSKCYMALERNVNPTDTLTAVNRDRNQEIRYCTPTAKTKIFAVVQWDNTIVRLDPAGNAKILEVVRQAGKTSRLNVQVTGEQHDHVVKADSIAAVK